MSTYVKTKHDIGLLRSDGSTTVGLRLARDKNGDPIYRAYDDEYLAQQLFTGTPGYGNLPPEKEIAMRQDDWRSGFGQEYYDAADPKRYFSSIGMDMRYKGMAVAGPISTSLTVPAPQWSSPTGHVDPDVAWAAEAQGYDENVGSVTSATPAALSWSSYLELTIASTAVHGVRYYVHANTDPEITQVDVDLYYGSAWHDLYEGAFSEGVWIVKYTTASRTVTAMRIRFYNSDGAVQKGVSLAEVDFLAATGGTAAYPVVFEEFNDKLYAGAGKWLLKLSSAGDEWLALTPDPATAGFDANITDLQPFTDDNLYIAIGTANDYWEMTTAEVFTENTLAVKTFQFFERVDAAAPTMWGNDGGNTIRSNTDPSNGGANPWSAQTTVDSSYHNITDLTSKSGALYIPKEDMPYYLNSAGAVQNDLAPELKSSTASTSGKNTFLWKNKLYIPFGTQGLLETDGTTNTFLNPASYCTNLSDFVGRVMAVSGDEEWLFVAVDNSTEIEILAGREETIDGTTGWIWHPIHELTLTGCETLFVSSVYQKRLWIASTSTSDSSYYIPLPTGYGDLENDANRSFKTDTYKITPWLHGNFKADTKAFIKIIAELGHSYDVDIYFECHYQVLGDTTWTDAGDLKGSATDRTATLFIPADASSNNPSSEMIRFKFVVKTDDVQKTPILLGYDCRAILYPTNRRIIECEVLCDDVITLKDGVIEKGQAANIKASLEEARNATWPRTFYEIGESTIYVKFLPLQTAVTKKEKSRGLERHYLLRLQEVALS